MNADDIEDLCELSALQQGILFHSIHEPRSGAYVVQLECTLHGPLDVAAFERAWQRVVDTHPILRTAFVWEGVERPLQVVLRRASFTLDHRDWRQQSQADQHAQLSRYLDEDRRRGFEPAHAPLMRAALFRVGDRTHRFVWTHHHIVLDGWSVGLVLAAVLERYDAERRGLGAPLEPGRPFSEYVSWERAQDRATAEAWWRHSLRGLERATGLDLEGEPRDRHREPHERVGEQRLCLSATETAELAAAARRHALTLSTVVQGAWGLLLSRYGGDDDIVFGTTVSTRPPDRPGSDSIVGPCINTIPVRLDATPSLELVGSLRRLQDQLIEALPHAHAALVDIQRWSDVPTGAPLFESIVAFESYPLHAALRDDGSGGASGAGLDIRDVRWVGSTSYALAVLVLPQAELTLCIQHDESRWGAELVAQMLGHYRELLRAMARGMDGTIGALAMLTEAERRRILVEWNDTRVPPPRERSVHELLEAQARRTPHAVAAVCEGAELTYDELDRRANQLAHHLRARGVAVGSLVGVLLDRSLELLVGLLGVWKAGGAFVPLDPSHPAERLAFMLADAEVGWVLTRQRLLPRLPRGTWGVIRLDTDGPALAAEPALAPRSGVLPPELAYVLYTSGSTGTPKGVMVPHGGLMRYLAWCARAYAIDAGTAAPVHTSVAFDLTLTALLAPLVGGGRVELLPDESGIEALAAALGTRSPSVRSRLVKLTPSHVELLRHAAPPRSTPGPCTFVVGGERLLAEHVAALRAFAPGAVIFNEYGPTEAVVGCCVHRVPASEVEPGPIPIGRPIDGAELYILDRHMSPVPPGVSGELYIGGTGLARGYLGRPELTAERFIAHPFTADPSARLHRTGDRARYRVDGTLEFLGRRDRQVKIRGVRIEPAEIEAALESHPAVREAAVVVREVQGGATELVAAWVPQRAAHGLSPGELRRFLLRKLPEPMVPARFAELERLPLTRNGKVDRAALLATTAAVPDVEASFVAPRTPVEEVLAEIWAQVVGLELVGIHDDFFALGGHSLSALRVLSRVRTRLQLDLSLARLLEARTIAQLAVVVEQARHSERPSPPLDAAPTIPRRPREHGPSPASFVQLRLWLLDQLDPGNPVYNGNSAVRIEGPLDIALLERALGEVVARHEILRTTFAMEQASVVQVIAPASARSFDLRQHSLGAPSRDARWQEAQHRLAAWARQPFDLQAGPLLRAWVLGLDEREHVLLLSMHHIISDGWSRDVLVREVAALYEAGLRGASAVLPQLPMHYADFAAWQRARAQGAEGAAQLAYWAQQLSGLTALELPTDRRRPSTPRSRGAQRPFTLPASLSRTIEALACDRGVTPFVTLLAAFVALLHRYTAAEDIAVGSPMADRGRPETEDLIGPFINTVVLRSRVCADTTFASLLEQVRRVVLEAQAHKDVPFEQVVAELGGDHDRSRNPLFDVLFDLQHAPPEPVRLPGLRLLPLDVDNGTAKVDLALHLWEADDGLRGSFEYSTELFDETTISRMVEHFGRVLEGALARPELPLCELPLLSDAERREQLLEWNDTRVDFPRDACLHHLFEAQARRTPDAIAVGLDDEHLTYGELNRRANRLAHHLQARGVGPDAVVGVHLERSVELVVALLGILKAGGAYLPLSPSLPRERLVVMLEDAKISVLLTRSAAAELPAPRAQRVRLDQASPAIACEPDTNPRSAVTATGLAYVIYTSGSTGRPKGVMIQHDGICNRLHWMQDAYRLTAADRVLHKTPLDFDVSVWEVFWPLITGARIVLARPGRHGDVAHLIERIVTERVTTVHFVPSLLRALVDEPGLDACRSLVRVVCSGEALPRELAERFSARSDAALHNLYGPTEASVDVSAWTWQRAAPRVLIGRPIANIRLHVLGPHQELLPIGVPGELYIGGVGLARGYLGQPELTAERFVPDPLDPASGARLYRTGDRCRYLEGGDLEFLGRLDDQVKIRGVRVEPGEVEAELMRCAKVHECVVTARHDGPGGARLVAYVVPSPGQPPSVDELRQHLGAALPDAMIPSAFVTLDAIPLTTSGKLDRRALPRPPADRPRLEERYVPPQTPPEHALSTIWSQVLGIERIGVHDDFFALGGDSMRALRVVALAQEQGLGVSLPRLFREPTIHALARSTTAAEPAPRPTPLALLQPEDRARVPSGIEDAYPLTALQLGMVFHDAYDPGARLYRNVDSVHLRARFEPERLREAAQRLVERHEILRTSFDLTGYGEAIQLVHERVELPLTVEDLRGLSPAEQQAHLHAWLEHQSHAPIDVTQAPLLRLHVHQRGEDRFQLTLPHHHAILDGWSVGALFAELMRDYLALLQGRPADAPPIEASFRDYVALERAALDDPAQQRYWAQHVGDGPLSTVRGFPDAGPDAGLADPDASARSGHREHRVELEVGAWEAVGHLAASAAVSRKSVLLAVHVRVLGLLTGRPEVVTGVATQGRPEQRGGDRVLGLFLNSTPLRIELRGGTWLELVREVFAHERESAPLLHYPLARMEHDRGGRPAFDTLFNHTHFHVLEPLAALEGVEVLERHSFARSSLRLVANFDVTPGVDRRLSLTLAYDGAELGDEQVQTIADLYRHTLTAMLRGPSRRYDFDDQRSAQERRFLLELGNDTRTDYPKETCLHRLFEAQARRRPHAPAVRFGDTCLTYGELERRALALARRLRALGVGPEVRVGVCLERSFELVVGILAVLAAGGAYVPLDPAHPCERRSFMLHDAGATTVLTQRRHAEGLAAKERHVLVLDEACEHDGALDRAPADAPAPAPAPVEDGGATARSLAYVMYTSGSTGTPKGVCITHRAVARLVLGTHYVELGPDDVVLQVASIAFDAFTFELWGALLNGATLALLDPHQPSLAELAAAIERHRATTMFLTPAVFDPLVDAHLDAFGGMKQVLVGGDVVSAPHALALARAHPGCRVSNGYGPTESTTFACCWPLLHPERALRAVPIGRPIANTRAYVLDDRLEPVPLGVPAELYLGGDGLARGYLDRPELTAERFSPDPFSDEPGARLYRTGDLVRRLPSGDLEFMGRIDRQVKIRGVRVELGEVEAAIRRHPAVREAVVELRENAARSPSLTAYLVLHEGTQCSSSELRRALERVLPEAMIPAAFVVLDALPLTTAGKLDRAALPSPARLRLELRPDFIAPRMPFEEILAAVWCELLGLEQVGVHDDFFELGGNSLVATQVISRLRERLQVDLPLRALFDGPTIFELAAAAQASRRAAQQLRAPPIVARPHQDTAVMTVAQEQLFQLDRVLRGLPLFNMPARLHVRGRLDVAALEHSLDALVARHELLRTTFDLVDERPMQIIAAARPVALAVNDLRALPGPERHAHADRLAHTEARTPFDLARGPLLRVSLLQLEDEEHLLLLTMHHILGDGWSMGVVMRELAALYHARLGGVPPALPTLPIRYADFAAWQAERLAGGGFEAELAHWTRQLAPPLGRLDFDCQPSDDGLGGLLTASVPVRLPPASLAALKALAQAHGMSSFMVVLAAFDVFLHHVTGQDDIRVGTLVANRTSRQTEGLIGLFLNTVVLRVDLGGDPTFREVLGLVRDQTLAAYDHQDVPFEVVLRALARDHGVDRGAVFQAMLVVQNAPLPRLSLPGLELRRWEGHAAPPLVATGVDLTLVLEEDDDGLGGSLIYRPDLFDPEAIERMRASLQALFGLLFAPSLAAREDERLSTLFARMKGFLVDAPARGVRA